ncbi:MAG: glycosyltransferase family 4 protein [Thermoanaerobaculia bacterium]
MKALFLNQAYFPDVVSTAQHAADLAEAMAARGDEVRVIASRRGYADPGLRFPSTSLERGVLVSRVWEPALEKRGFWRRVVRSLAFFAGAGFRALAGPRPDVLVVMTSPPLLPVLGRAVAALRRRPYVVWLMDLNPDEAIAAGALSRNGIAAKVLRRLTAFSLRGAARVVVLDRFMREKVESYGVPAGRIEVLPPWSHDTDVRDDADGRRRFRKQHGLEGRMVVMYAGNLSLCHPLDTLIETARRLKEDPVYLFLFVGGGEGVRQVAAAESEGLSNVRRLPYQPREDLAASLSAADVHVVVMGDAFVGILHPCKVYNVLRVNRPVLSIGPESSPVADALEAAGFSAVWRSVRHGDVDGAAAALEELAGRRASRGAPGADSTERLLPRMMAVLDRMARKETETP